MKLLGLDFETTGVDIETLRVTEVGAVLYDWDLMVPIEVQADLVKEADLRKLDDIIVELTGITDEMIYKYGKDPLEVITRLVGLIDKADYIVAHNGNEFDRPILDRFIKRNTPANIEINAKKIHWIDTMTDIDYPRKIGTRKLEDLAGRHGFLNPFPHRAFTDVMAMMKILDNYNLEKVIEISHSPTVRYNAMVDYHARDVAKRAGFKWDTVERVWFYTVKECFVTEELLASWDFPFKKVQHGQV